MSLILLFGNQGTAPVQATVTWLAFDTAAPVAGAITGDLAATETGADTAAASGRVVVTGLLAATESGSDTATASGRVLVQGTLSAQEVGGDTADITNVVAIAPDEPLFVGEVDLRRWYVRRGKRLHIFDRAEDADAFLDAERQAADAVAQAQKTSRRARKRLRAKLVLPEPEQTIDVDQLTRWAAEFNLDANLPALMARQDYARIEQLMAAAWAMQDERDVEELLLLL